MANDKQPMQANGKGMPPIDADDPPTADRPNMFEDSGQSGGGAYPNPYDRKGGNPEEKESFHGGQSIAGYHGDGQLGSEDVGETDNAPALTKEPVTELG